MQLSTTQYDALERAITHRTRIMVMRRGSEYVVVPERLRIADGIETIIARHPSTGQYMELRIDDIDVLEILT